MISTSGKYLIEVFKPTRIGLSVRANRSNKTGTEHPKTHVLFCSTCIEKHALRIDHASIFFLQFVWWSLSIWFMVQLN